MALQCRYTNRTLNGNWYEDRFETEESPYITLKEKMRPGYGGGPIPLKQGFVPDMYVTVHAETHAHALPAHRAALAETQRLIEMKKHASLLSVDSKKDIVSKHSKHFPKFYGYGAVIPRHKPGYDHRILSTTSHTDYGGAYTANVADRKEHFTAAANTGAAAAPAPAPVSVAVADVKTGSGIGGRGSGSGLTTTQQLQQLQRPSTTPLMSRSPLVTSHINVSVDPTRPLTKPPPHSLSSTAHTAVVSSVIGNPLIDPAASHLGAAGRHSSTRSKRSGTVSFGATGERLRVGPNFDPKEHTFVQRAWLYDRSVNTSYVNNKKDKYEGLAAIPGAGLPIGTGTGFGVRDTRTSYGRRSMAWKDPTGIWSG